MFNPAVLQTQQHINCFPSYGYLLQAQKDLTPLLRENSNELIFSKIIYLVLVGGHNKLYAGFGYWRCLSSSDG